MFLHFLDYSIDNLKFLVQLLHQYSHPKLEQTIRQEVWYCLCLLLHHF